MPNSKKMLNDLNFDHQIKKMVDRDLLEFVSIQVYELKGEMQTIKDCVKLNTDRIWKNRITLIALIAVLAGLGIIELKTIFGLGG